MTFDQTMFRKTLGRFATGVAVVTTCTDAGRPLGMTINSLVSLSLDPPLVLYGLGRSSVNFDAFAKAGAFAFNILAEDQQELSARFADHDRQADFTGVPFAAGASGAPVLKGVLASIDCRREQAVDAGDHVIVIGLAIDLRCRDGRPLLYFAGAYERLF